MASEPWDQERGVWVAWERTAQAADDARGLVVLLHRIAEGTEPVWDQAAWTADGHGVPDPSAGRRSSRKSAA
ncbi:hypothetical protein F3K43_47375 [Streptomyces sp. LBUM 1476]|nr:hypothetical protein [Streptomyces sp. LBUM 1476]